MITTSPPEIKKSPLSTSILQRADAALPTVLREHCQAEAETMWEDLNRRLCALPDRKAEFVKHMTHNLLSKISFRQREHLRKALVARIAGGEA